VVVEELDESDNWLTTLRETEIAEPPQELTRECRELRAILATSCATARKKQEQEAKQKAGKPKPATRNRK
jgi:hypothetical protein